MGRQAAILDIDSSVMRRLKREATRRGKTMSELVETALRWLFPLHEPSRRRGQSVARGGDGDSHARGRHPRHLHTRRGLPPLSLRRDNRFAGAVTRTR